MKQFLLSKLTNNHNQLEFYAAKSNGLPMFTSGTPSLTWGAEEQGTWYANKEQATFFHNGGKMETIIVDPAYRTYGRIHTILQQHISRPLAISTLLAHEILDNGVYISTQCHDNNFGFPVLLEPTLVKNFKIADYFLTLIDDVERVINVLQPINFPIPTFETFTTHRFKKASGYEIHRFTKFIVTQSSGYDIYTQQFNQFLTSSASLLTAAELNDIKLYAGEKWERILRN